MKGILMGSRLCGHLAQEIINPEPLDVDLMSISSWLCHKIAVWSGEMEVELSTHSLQGPPSSEAWWLHESLHKSPLIWWELLALCGLQKETTNLLLEAFSALTSFPELPRVLF